jgi:hypothetical protein
MIKRGIRIRIKKGCRATRNSPMGYNDKMKLLEGTYQMVKEVDDEHVYLRNLTWTWHIDDIEFLENPKDLTMNIPKGKETFKFNPKELV